MGLCLEVLFMEPFLALLVSTDSGPVNVTQKILEEHGVSVKVVVSVSAAEQLIRTTKFDLGVFDHDVPDALNLAVWRGASTNPKMVFAMVRGANLNEVGGKRVQFVLQKPFTADLFARTLRAAYGAMIRDRRVAFRHPVQIKPATSALIQKQGNQNLQSSMIVDISQTGLCIQTQEILPQGATLQIDFQLPDGNDVVHTTGSVMWTRASGRTGIKFIQVPAAEQKSLIAWLDGMLPYEMESVPRIVPPGARQDRPELQM
jgi:DNA-binding response OmpR family regulator